MGYVITPKPQFSSRKGNKQTVIVAVLSGPGRLCYLSRKAPPGAVVAGPTGRCCSTITALTRVAVSSII